MEVDELVFKNVTDAEHNVVIDTVWLIGIKQRSSGLLWLERVPDRKDDTL